MRFAQFLSNRERPAGYHERIDYARQPKNDKRSVVDSTLIISAGNKRERPQLCGWGLPILGRNAQTNTRFYLSWVEMLENVLFNVVPRPLTTAIIATEIPAAIRPYSIAVAPD